MVNFRRASTLVLIARVRDEPGKLETCHKPYMEMTKQLFQITKKYLWKCDGIGAHAFIAHNGCRYMQLFKRNLN